MSAARVFLAAQSLAAGNGGICRVARLMARVLQEEAAAGRLCADGVVLDDPERPADLAVPVSTARSSRLRFVLRVQAAGLTHSHFLYDFLGIARAHCRLPWLRRPLLSYVHGIEVWEGAPRNRLRAARRADVLVANTAYTRDRAERAHGGFARARVCWLATETDAPPSSRPARTGPPTVLILGRIDGAGYKGHRELIGCWPNVVSAVPDARLLVVGSGPGLEATRRQAAVSPACHRIEFRGFVPEADLDGIWAETTVFAMPSRGEGFGLVYIEAMRHGLPVIASVHDAAPEVNLEGQTGYNVNLDRPEELPERIIHLLKDPDAAAALGAAGRGRWAEHFCYSAFRHRFAPLLADFLAGRTAC